MNHASHLTELVSAIKATRKYGDICSEAIEHIGTRELTTIGDLGEAIKATKKKLHQTAGAYLTGRPPYTRWLTELKVAIGAEGRGSARAVCLKAMGAHASTRERLSILEEFFADALREVSPVHSIIDIACGLNPLAIPWMPLAPDVVYYAYDIYNGLARFLTEAMAVLGVRGSAQACDVLHGMPGQAADVAYLLKALPCFEQLDRSAGERLLQSIPAKHVLVSFPIQSLGGRRKGMLAQYETHFRTLVRDRPWTVRRFAFDTELAFLVTKAGTRRVEDQQSPRL